MSYTLSSISTKSNPEQAELARLIHEDGKQIIYCTGNAGTGKTFTALATALKLIEDKKYKKILYIREPIEVGRRIGYLPGDMDNKLEVYMGPLYDNLEEIARICKRNPRDLLSKVEALAPQYTRGCSWNNGIIAIVDEAQNLSRLQIKTLLTRCGDYSKIILLGSTNQIDDEHMTKSNNEFMKTYEILKDQPFIGYVNLIKSERSGICSIIDELL